MCTATLHVVHISLAWAASNEVLHVAKYMYNVISSLQCLTTGKCRCADATSLRDSVQLYAKAQAQTLHIGETGVPMGDGVNDRGPRHFENCTLEWPRRVISPGALCKNNGQRLQHCLLYLLPKVASYRSTSLIRSTDCSGDCRGCYERLKTGRDRNARSAMGR